MKIFAIGDLHLSFDERVEKPMDIFGERWVDHAKRLKQEWLQLVETDDLVILCGDLSWGLRLEEAKADLDWIHALPGKKLMVKGNHDLWWQSIGKLNQMYDDDRMHFLQCQSYLIGKGTDGKKIAVCGSRGWTCPGTEGFTAHDSKIYDRELLRLEMSLKDALRQGAEEIYAVLHFPPTNDKHQESGFTKLMSQYGVKTCVYGHLHGKDAFKIGLKGNYKGVEYKLVSLDYLQGKPEQIL